MDAKTKLDVHIQLDPHYASKMCHLLVPAVEGQKHAIQTKHPIFYYIFSSFGIHYQNSVCYHTFVCMHLN